MAPLAYMDDDEDEGGPHDDSGQNVLFTAPLLEGQKPTVVIITQPRPGKAIMPEEESTEHVFQHQQQEEEERKNRPEVSEILVGSSDLGDVAVVSEDGLATTSKEEDILQSDLELPTVMKQVSVNGSMLTPPELTKQMFRVSVSAGKKSGLQRLSPMKKHTLGIGFIVIHCLTVVFTGQLSKATYSKDFSAPFFLVYFRTAWRALIFPAFMVVKYIYRRMRAKDDKPVSFVKTFTDSVGVFGPQGLTIRSFFYPCGFLSGLWLILQFMHLFAVKFLNNSIVQALFCAETAFCYTLSVIFLKAPVYALKVLAVTVALGGVGLMAYSQSQGNNLRWEGVLICMIGAVLGSVYMVVLKKMLGKSEDVGQALLLATGMAVFVTLFLWPVVLILYYTGVEYWNADTFPWAIICASSALSFFSVSIFNLCLTLTSPLLMTLSKLLGIPVNYVIDWMIWEHQFDGYQVSGVILICYGFVFIALPERWITLKKWAKCFRKARSPSTSEVPPSKSTAGPV
ncbi:hypothetical protein RvY_12627 [Ramazzottius varieornatus]|uniref:EamA domain-containing protein n=1 Tax=Ramazzottius varieornatus TaxID=947166 RepID=A0A1D1VK72_RAMVA|nr:hypothetical protein RvY_12627 [Ramazzottius varieornatus]